jgi:hypothetical protein
MLLCPLLLRSDDHFWGSFISTLSSCKFHFPNNASSIMPLLCWIRGWWQSILANCYLLFLIPHPKFPSDSFIQFFVYFSYSARQLVTTAKATDLQLLPSSLRIFRLCTCTVVHNYRPQRTVEFMITSSQYWRSLNPKRRGSHFVAFGCLWHAL